MKLRLVLLIIIVFAVIPSLASAGEDFDYEVVGGNLSVFGHLLEPKFPIKASTPPEDTDTLISFNQSPSGRWIIVRTGLRLETEMWLYDTRTEKEPVKIPVRPRGNHVFSEWHNDDVFEIRHAGMGYWESDFFLSQNLKESFQVDFVLLYDPDRDIYVSFYQDGVEVGKGFNRENFEPERFDIKFDYKYVSDAVYSVENVIIQGQQLIVSHKVAGVLMHETLNPKVLQTVEMPGRR